MHTPETFPLTRGALNLAITGPEAVGLGIIAIGVVLLVIALVLLAIVYNRRRDRMR